MNQRSQFILLYLIEFVTSAAASLLMMGIYFFTTARFGWDSIHNLALATGMGAIYTVSALFAHPMSARFGRRKSLAMLYAAMAAILAVAALTPSQSLIVIILLIYALLAALNWPMMESLCSAASDPHEMSRRVGIYNLVWASSGALMLFGTGSLIEHWPRAVFLLPLALHVLGSVSMVALTRAASMNILPENREVSAQMEPEPDLLHSRTLALWLSRIVLPAMYVVNGSLSAIFPLLPVIRSYAPATQTLYGSIWLAARFAIFVVLGPTLFWHTRPRLLLGAAVAMLIAFLLVTVAPSQILGAQFSHRFDLGVMIAGQILLGAAMGVIYTASLYFGMVLSDGSTAHGGYHEALIGLGGLIGPGAAVITQSLWPGQLFVPIATVATLIAVCVMAAAIVSLRVRH